jgi:trehalose 6-phosphate synthase
MSRLIVVSNRVNPPVDPGVATAGGLAMALAAALKEDKGVWFGWSGETADHFTGQLSMQKIGGVTVALVDLEEQDRTEYYDGFANRTLWPLFHHRTDLVAYERSFNEGYLRVNERFAETLLPLIQPDDLIWVQDYHLIPLALELRRRGVKNRIGFFLHIPWPARHILQTLPRHIDLVEAFFAYDLVGFHTRDYLDAFVDYVVNEADGVFTDGKAQAFGRTVQAGVFPIGIDFEAFRKGRMSEPAIQMFNILQSSKLNRKMLIGVDRLDYSKGLEERFLAYERFLAESPERSEQVFLLQIATPSRTAVEAYQDLRARLDTISGRINGSHATVDWVPLRYVNRAYRRDQLSGVYRAADVGLVTPLRDGMNLVAKEYVAAQDEDDPGVLVLSEFAGAAEEMKDALIINPFSQEDVADAIRRGLDMPLAERKRRWENLMSLVSRGDVDTWRDSFVTALRAVTQAGARPGARP